MESTSAVAVLVVMSLVTAASAYNPCCSYPCQNQGVCSTGREPGSYTCDCTNLQFYGQHCQIPTLVNRLKLLLKPSSETVHNLLVSSSFKWVWDVVNSVDWLHDFFTKQIYLLRANIVVSPPVYETGHEYPTMAAFINNSYYARTLPPVPLDCPTPMGVKGNKNLPDVDKLIKTFFVRKKFRPEPMGSSVLMAYFAQHFTHMFFKTDFRRGPGFTWSGHGVDVTSIYGKDESIERALRSMEGGRFKMQTLNGEEYPLYLKDVPGFKMDYPSNVPEDRQFALAHPFNGLLPGLFLYQTIWMREHNRVCEVLHQEHPSWDDERLFQTGKLIVLGETIKIVIEDYVEHLANYNIRLKFKPHVLFGESFQYQNKISVEFDHLYHWHPLMPDEFPINGSAYSIKEALYNADLVVKYGTSMFTDSLSKQRAGHMSHHNHGPYTLPVLRDLLHHGRKLRIQSFNNYRKWFHLEAYTSFEELTGEKVIAAELQKVYGDIDALEFFVGLIMEKRRERNLFGAGIVEIGGPFSVKGLLSSPICSMQHWKPSTFGGDVGFNIVKTATLEGLFCANIKGPCPVVLLRVPDFRSGDVDESSTYEFKRPTDEL